MGAWSLKPYNVMADDGERPLQVVLSSAQSLNLIESRTEGEIVGDLLDRRVNAFVLRGGIRFSSRVDPLVADKSIRDTKRILSNMKLTSLEKTELAVVFLDGVAVDWWEMTKRMKGVDLLPWEEFRTSFEELFVPYSFKAQRCYQFPEFRQGDRSVTEYALHFVEELHFVRDIVSTPEILTSCFWKGLNEPIRSQLIAFQDRGFAEIYSLALTFERSQKTRGLSSDGVGRDARTEVVQGQRQRKHTCGSARVPRAVPKQEVSAYRKFDEQISQPRLWCRKCRKRGHLEKNCFNSEV